jgi:hypothetical protein
VRNLPPGMVAMPALDWMWTGTVVSLQELELPPGSQVLIAHGSTALVLKRNTLVRQFLAAQPKLAWLLFLDADMVFPPHTIRRLLAWNVDVVSGLYGYKSDGEPVVGWLGDEQDRAVNDVTGLTEVKEVGAGCLMIRRRVVEAVVAEPWFQANLEDIQEDVAFCQKVRAAGLKVHVDADFVVGHIGPVAVTPDFGYAQLIMQGIKQARKDGLKELTLTLSDK